MFCFFTWFQWIGLRLRNFQWNRKNVLSILFKKIYFRVWNLNCATTVNSTNILTTQLTDSWFTITQVRRFQKHFNDISSTVDYTTVSNEPITDLFSFIWLFQCLEFFITLWKNIWPNRSNEANKLYLPCLL